MIFPPNIERFIPESLSESDLPSNDTEMFSIPAYPDLVVRFNDCSSFERFSQANMATRRMRKYGLDVLPSKIVEGENGNYTITKRVTGANLEDLLRDDPTPELINRTDKLFAGLGRWLLQETSDDRQTAADVYNANQFMQGTISNDPAEKIWLVDFPQYPSDDEDYTFNIRCLTNGILESEAHVKRRLLQARAALEDTLPLISLISHDRNTAAEVREALATNTQIDLDG
jgi:hypothetical protein